MGAMGIMRWRALAVAILLATAISGCMTTENDRERAVALAKEEMLRRGWKEMELQEANLEAGVWQISLWRLPKVPGGHATVEISSDGKVIRVLPGR